MTDLQLKIRSSFSDHTASALRRISWHSSRWETRFLCRKNFCHQCLETWIAAQRVKHRINFDTRKRVITISTLEVVDGFIFFAQCHVDTGKGAKRDISMGRNLVQLCQKLHRLIAFPELRVGVSNEPKHNGIAVPFGSYSIFRECFAELALKFQRHAKVPMRVIKARIHLDCFSQLRDCFVIASCRSEGDA